MKARPARTSRSQGPVVSDILINTHKQVYVERLGRLEPTPARFKDERHLLRVIQKIVSAVGRRVDESQPWVDARLPDGSRVNVLVPPCAVDGPLVSIRKVSKMPFTVPRLIEIGSIDERMSAFRVDCAPRLKERRVGQDDPAERALEFHQQPRAHHHH
jgi:pilus assembly protein CpaF